MSTPPELPIESRHVARQFARRAPLDAAQFLYGEISQRLAQRLGVVRLVPDDLLDAGCGAAHALATLRARYPEAGYTGLDACAPLLAAAREQHPASVSLWQRLRGQPAPPAFVHADLADTGLPPESQDLIWSNLALHWHPAPHRVLAEWRRLLRPGGLAMFSCLGPGSLREVRQAVQDADLHTATLPLVDMHDLGDLLLVHGMADPVLDQETLTLTYQTPERLLDDLRVLGGNPNPQRRAGLAGRAWRDRLLAALAAQRRDDGLIPLTIEVAYGHAWRAASHRADSGETRIAVSAIGRRPRPER